MRESAGVSTGAVLVIPALDETSAEVERMVRQWINLSQQCFVAIDNHRNSLLRKMLPRLEALYESQVQAVLLRLETIRTDGMLPGPVESQELAHGNLGRRRDGNGEMVRGKFSLALK